MHLLGYPGPNVSAGEESRPNWGTGRHVRWSIQRTRRPIGQGSAAASRPTGKVFTLDSKRYKSCELGANWSAGTQS
jgi:hypothetical protein